MNVARNDSNGRMTAREGRRFGATVGTAFLVLAGVTWWRSHPTLTAVLAALGAIFLLGGLLVPTRMGPIERTWMRMALLISKVTTPIVMAVIYLLVLTPVGLLRRTAAQNPLVHVDQERSYWQRRPSGRRSSNMRRQF